MTAWIDEALASSENGVAGIAVLGALARELGRAETPAARAVLVSALYRHTPAIAALGLSLATHENEFDGAMNDLRGFRGMGDTIRELRAKAKKSRPAPEPRAQEGQTVEMGDDDMLSRGDELEVAILALAEHLGEHTVYDLGALHRYDERAGAWVDYERHHVVQVVSRYAGRPVFASSGEDGIKTRALRVSNAFANGAASLIESHRRKRKFFDSRAQGCGFRNGFLRADGAWLDKGPEHRLLPSDVLPFDYAPIDDIAAIPRRAPVWSRFLTDLFALDDDSVEKVLCIQEFVGVAMLGLATRYEKALLLYGPKAGNGKSTLMNVLRQLFAPSARCSVPPHLMGERFENVPLATARMNMVSDMPDAEILDAGNLKATISGDELQFNPKNRDPFSACPRAAHVFALNSLPHVRDKSRGFSRRMLPVEFRRSFDESPDQVRDMASRVLEEREQIAAACICAAMAMVRADRGYTLPASTLEVIRMWETRTNPVREWASMFEAVKSATLGVRGTDMYAAYAIWCKDTGHKPVGRNTLFAELDRVGWGRAAGEWREWLVRPMADTEAEQALRAANKARR